MGVDVHESAAAARPDRGARTPETVRAVALLVTVNFALCVMGIWTGNGPLGPPASYGVAATRPVGVEVTEGSTGLVNHSVLPAHIESIKPMEVGATADGLATTAIELGPAKGPRIGLVDGPGYDLIPAADRAAVDKRAIAPDHRVGGEAASVPILVRLQATKPRSTDGRGGVR